MKTILSLVAAAFLAIAPSASASGQATPFGVWKNPKGSVIVRAAPCEGKLCGTVVWASPKAMADARDGGDAHLIGTQLLQDYVPDGRGRWKGHVLVPDMGGRYISTIEQQGPDRLRISGCIFSGLICKHQIWSRG